MKIEPAMATLGNDSILDRFGLGTLSQMKVIRIVICVFFLFQMLITWPLWLPERVAAPFVPIHPRWPVYPGFITALLSGVLVLSLLLSLMGWRSRLFLYLAFISYALLAFGDANRLQPYFYQFSFMLLALSVYTDPASERERLLSLNIMRLILFGMYFWSGAMKVNSHFIDVTFPWSVKHIFGDFSENWESNPIKYVALILPGLEILFALILLTKFRRVGVIGMALVHIYIIVMCVATDWNLQVIPWNIVLMVMLFLLFWSKDKSNYRALFKPQRSLLKVVAVLLFILIPVFGRFGKWDHYLSASLYSGLTPYAVVYLEHAQVDELPDEVKPFLGLNKEVNMPYLDLNKWIQKELHVLVYPQPRVYSQIHEHVKGWVAEPEKTKLVIYF